MTKIGSSYWYLVLLQFPLVTNAAAIAVGEPLPEVQIAAERGGELVLEAGEIEYRDWQSSQLVGRTHLIYHLAARMGIDKINEDTVEKIAALELPEEKFLIVSLLNLDDAVPGGGLFARREFEKNRKLHPHPKFVIDKGSAARKTWGLKRKSSTLIVVDEAGTVVFFKDDQVGPEEAERLLKLLQKL